MKDWIIVISSEKGYQRKYYTQATHDCSSGPDFFFFVKERKENVTGLRGRQKSLSRPAFSFRSSLKHSNTDPRNRNL